MKRFRKIIKKIFFLSPLLTFLISVPSFIIVIYVLLTQNEGPLAILAYIASTYALIISLTSTPAIIKALRQAALNNSLVKNILSVPLGDHFFHDVEFRTEVSLSQGLFMNLLYVVLKLASGFYYHSVWFFILALYYALLAVLRIILLHSSRNDTTGNHLEYELRRYRLCGIILFFMNQVLTGVLVIMILGNRNYEFPGMLLYVMALYVLYTVILSVINAVRFRKHSNPVLSAAKNINLVAALVSILALESAMAAQFLGDNLVLRQVITGIVGGIVCILVLGMAIWMLVKSSIALKRLKSGDLHTK